MFFILSIYFFEQRGSNFVRKTIDITFIQYFNPIGVLQVFESNTLLTIFNIIYIIQK